MALFRVTAKQSKNTNGIRVEKGMSVEVVINSVSNPLKRTTDWIKPTVFPI